MDIERRFIKTNELRADVSNDRKHLIGYAALFNTWSADLGGFRERIAPGAFRNSLGADVRALFNHDPNYVLGRTVNGTLSLKEDDRGLLIDVTLPDVGYANDLHKLIGRGDVSQMSFGFKVLKDSWAKGSDGLAERTLVEAELFDVAPVTYPAYENTEVSARQVAVEIMSKPDNGRADGFSRSIELDLLDLS